MQKVLFSVLVAAALAIPAFAADKAPTAQQQRMTDCNADAKAKGLKGDERKAFMSSCLKGESAAGGSDKQKAQREKMKTCNADAKAKGLKGDERKKFMSDCLSN